MLQSFDVSVRGGGVVGCALALALAHQGHRIALQRAAASARGDDIRCYALNAASVALLRELKVWSALPADAVTPVQDMHVEGDARGSQLEFSAWSQGVEALAWIVDAAALDAALDSAVRFAPHVHEVAPDTETGSVLTAVCEGRHSPCRERLGVSFDEQPYGQRALATRVVAEHAHAGTARQWFRAPDVLALLPFDRPEAGCSYGLVWSLPEERADALCGANASEFEAALQDATGDSCGALRLDGPRATWPLALGRADRLCGPGWVLLGDCAHLIHPLAGQGLNLGLADVAVLSRVLAEREPWRGLGDERLLRRYARERDLPIAAMGQLTDGLLRLFADPAPWVKELRNRGLTLVDHVTPLKRWLAGRALGS
jgi:ubiquinone biosynthesis UbiH/UbiF/VisC/COQ6 family hydroxylase